MSTRAFLMALACALGLLRAQETLSSVQRELDRVERETEREKELHKSERKRAAEFEADKAAKLKALQDQLRVMASRIDSLKRRAESARQKKASHKAQIAQYQARQKDFAKAFSARVRDMAADVRKDFPYDREKRAADLEDLANAVDNGTVGVEEGLNRFFSLAQANLDFAYGTEVYRGSYHAADGSDAEGNFVRLGAALLAFAGDDGKTAAYLARTDTGYAWRETEVTPGIRDEIFQAVKVAQGKVAPRLIGLPFEAPGARSAPAVPSPATKTPPEAEKPAKPASAVPAAKTEAKAAGAPAAPAKPKPDAGSETGTAKTQETGK